MTSLSVQEAFDLALKHHQAGRLAEAEKYYRQVLVWHPHHPETIHFLGAIALQTRRHDLAVDLMQKAIAIKPDWPEACNNLSVALRENRQFDESIAAARQAIALRANYPQAWNNLGNALKDRGLPDEAIAAHRQAVALSPDYAEAHYNLGNALMDKGERAQAIASYRSAVAIRPDYAEAYGNLGVALKDHGSLDEAIEAHRRVIALRPEFAQGHNNLGNALKDQKKFEEAMAAYREAIARDPQMPEAHNNLGDVLTEQAQYDEAIAACNQAISLRPNYADAFCNLGNALAGKHELEEAISAYRHAILLKPDFALAYFNLGTALRDKEQLDEAIAAQRMAISLNPNLPEAYNNLGIALKEKGQLEEAGDAHRQAIALDPNYAAAHSNLGMALTEQGQLDEAMAAHLRSVALNPNVAESYTGLAATLNEKGEHDEAKDAYRHAISLKPTFVDAHQGLGTQLHASGQLDEAIAAYRQAITIKPDFASAHANLIYAMLSHPGYDAQAVAQEARRWNDQHAEPLRKLIQPHRNDGDPDRRLRIGYVSGDFREHVVGRNILPLLQHHDHQQFEIHCYAQIPRPDGMTQLCRQSADAWHSILRVSDEESAKMIRDDQIDILVDLAGHTAGNRLFIFARKPAPVQLTYLGYNSTTGLRAMDYRLSDSYLDPPEVDSSDYTETTVRLPHSYWCYRPSLDRTPQPAPAPVLKNGFVTFGCLSNFSRISPAALDLWGRILQAMPNSRIIVHALPGTHRDNFARRLERLGVANDRLEFIGYKVWTEFVETYAQIDIALDPFPHGGAITTCDALWMGVPVVTLSGQTAAGRAARSALSNIGLQELVAYSQDEYMKIVLDLAGDPDRMAALRSGMRLRMVNSPLMDAAGFARDVEAVYRRIWRTWCKQASSSQP